MIGLIKKKELLLKNTLCLIAGCSLPFAFSPFNAWVIAPIAVAILWYCWLNASPKQALLLGLLFSTGFYGIGVSWVYISIHRFGHVSILLASLITFLFVIVLALCTAIQGYLLSVVFKMPAQTLRESWSQLLLAFPASWVIVEWVRGWLFTGFPWLYLGYSQTDSVLKGYIPIIGVYGVSFLVAFSAGLLVMLLKSRRKKVVFFCVASLLLIWLGGRLCSEIRWTKPQGDPISVSIIQGNIAQEDKWLPQNVLSIFDRYLQLSEKSWQKDLMIWPEAAIPLPLPYSQDFVNHLLKTVKQYKMNLIVGMPVQIEQGDFYNAAAVLSDQLNFYYKRHLVPFGEYLPFKQWISGFMDFLKIPMSDFVKGSRHQQLLMVRRVPVAIYICYEIAYAELVRDDLPAAQLLVTLTDDAWFGDSFAPFQHLQIARIRSLETGRYGICSTNNGITAIIAPDGKILKTLPQFKTGVLIGEVSAMAGTTPWVKIGSWMIISMMFLLLLIAWIFGAKIRDVNEENIFQKRLYFYFMSCILFLFSGVEFVQDKWLYFL